jgi:hypothetical protein
MERVLLSFVVFFFWSVFDLCFFFLVASTLHVLFCLVHCVSNFFFFFFTIHHMRILFSNWLQVCSGTYIFDFFNQIKFPFVASSSWFWNQKYLKKK